MKATGIVRRVDDLGRIVIPREIRKRLNITDGQPMELYVEDESVIFKKYDFLEGSRCVIKKTIDFVREDTDLGVEKRNEVLAKMKEALAALEKKVEGDV